jgi:hypothetical protein
MTVASSATAGAAPAPWPPADGRGELYVHYGEEHVNDDDGPTLLPAVVRSAKRYRPDLVTMSADKANDGEPEQFALWSAVMDAYDRAGVPWFAAVGNHDRKSPPGVPPGTSPTSDLGPYVDYFADRPYPMGDARAYDDRAIRTGERPAGDPDGASSHYFVDTRLARWVFIDNSCWSIIGCDPLQSPSAQNEGGDEPQFDFLERVGSAASEGGKRVFVVMHMPTRDPRDQSYADPTSVMHTMGKGPLGTADNTTFESTAAAAGVDGVFLAHIKGQFLYRGEGDVPYFIDGGAGGELYTTGPVGVDHGYWHGYRLVRVAGRRMRTDVVPIFVEDGIRIDGPRKLALGAEQTFAAYGRQPVFNDPAKVEALELRDPDPIRPNGSSALGWVPDAGIWLLPPLSVLLLIALGDRATRRRRRVAAPALAALGLLAVSAGVSMAQQSEPTTTPVESLPNPARIWTTSNPRVLAPVPSASDDARRNRRTQTEDGRFRAICPGRAKLTISSGFEGARARVRVQPGRANAVPRRCRGL